MQTELLENHSVSENDVIKLKFSWYDDHSKYRLDDSEHYKEEIKNIFQKYFSQVPTFESYDDLNKVANILRSLYKESNSLGEDVKRALELADEIAISDELQAFDAEMAYEDIIGYIEEQLEEWAENKSHIFSSEEWDIDPVKLFNFQKSGRYGLGDSFAMEIHNDYIEMPNGEIVHGVITNQLIEDVFYNITIDCDDESAFGEVLLYLLKVPEEKLTPLRDITQILNDCNVMGSISNLLNFLPTLLKNNCQELERIQPYLSTLGESWYGTEVEMIEASLIL